MDPIYDLNKPVSTVGNDSTFRAPTTGTTGVREDVSVDAIPNIGTSKDAPSEAPWRSGDHDGIITA